MWLYYCPSRRELIERKQFVVPGASHTFYDLDQFTEDFEALELSVYGRSERGNTQDDVEASFNGDIVDANYHRQRLTGQAAAVSAGRHTDRIVFPMAGGTGVANLFSGGHCIIPSYADTDRHKHRISIGGNIRLVNSNITIASGRWKNTDPITSIIVNADQNDDLDAGTYLELSGVVPLDTVIRRRQDKIAANRDSLINQQMLRPGGKAWRH